MYTQKNMDEKRNTTVFFSNLSIKIIYFAINTLYVYYEDYFIMQYKSHSEAKFTKIMPPAMMLQF